MEATQDDSIQKEISVFNTGFEAYNKKIMYGADIISVLNKAIDNNKTYGVEFYDSPSNPEMLDYYVDVIFKQYRRTESGDITDELITYSLKENYTKSPNTNIIKNQFLNLVTSKNKADIDRIHQLKVAGFKCTGVSYVSKKDTNNIGAINRLNKIEFTEIKRAVGG